MAERITQRDIAKKAGVSHVTVSLAMRGSPRLPIETIQRIRDLATKMGYAPDPMLKALASYRKSQRPPAFQSTLAWINNWPQPSEFHSFALYHSFYKGAKERAQELGFTLDEINLASLNYQQKLLQKLLTTRNIKGILIAPVWQPTDQISLDWTCWTTVRIGYSLSYPQLHTITNSQFRSTYTATKKLIEHGYRRIGLVISRLTHQRTGGHFLGGYVSAQQALPEKLHLKSMKFEDFHQKEFFSIFQKWIQREKPDVIITDSPHILETSHFFKKIGIAYASLTLTEDDEIRTGIYQSDRQVGRSGIDLLISKMDRQETGIPAVPMNVLVDGVWRPGKTAPVIKSI